MNSEAARLARTVPVVSVLVILEKDTWELPPILRHSNWDIQTVADVEDAISIVQSAAPCVVIAPYRTSGGAGWSDLPETLRRSGSRARLVVTDCCTDDAMWADVLSLGAYDVLSQPFEPPEVFRVITGAWNSLREQIRHELHNTADT